MFHFKNRIGEEEEGEESTKENGFENKAYERLNDVQKKATQISDKSEELSYGLWVGSHSNDIVSSRFILLVQQFSSLIAKRAIHSARNKSLTLSQIALPLIILMINLLLNKYGPIKTS